MKKKYYLIYSIILLCPLSLLCQKKSAFVDEGSLYSLKIFMQSGKDIISTGTAFIIKKDSINFLITNPHNFTGIDYWTGKYFDSSKRIPTKIIIQHHKKNKLGEWISKSYDLYDGKNEKWNSVFIDGKVMDVASLKLTDTTDVEIFDAIVDHNDSPFRIPPGTQLFVIGYPFGITASKQYPVWKTAHLASEYEDNYKDIPVFLVDGTTRSGMSGSPVFLKGQYYFFEKAKKKSFPIEINAAHLFGIYSGHIDTLELGAVFKVEVIEELLKQSK